MTPAATQTLVVVLIIAGALLYLGRRFWRTMSAARARRKGDVGCAAGCGCEATPAVTTLKARK
jgi:hypothetical protein